MGMPVLMDSAVLTLLPLNHGDLPPLQITVKYIPVGGGPTLEYYTQLAHFSVGMMSMSYML